MVVCVQDILDYLCDLNPDGLEMVMVSGIDFLADKSYDESHLVRILQHLVRKLEMDDGKRD